MTIIKRYIVKIEETVVEDFVVFANEDEDPLQIAEEKYRSGEFVLCPGEVQYRRMAVTAPISNEPEWVVF